MQTSKLLSYLRPTSLPLEKPGRFSVIQTSLWFLLVVILWQFVIPLCVVVLGNLNLLAAAGEEDMMRTFGLLLSGPEGIRAVVYGFFGGLVITLLVCKYGWPSQTLQKIGWVPVAWQVVAAWAGLTALYIVLDALLMGAFDVQESEFMTEMSGLTSWMLFLLAVVLAPIVEEFLFRGLLVSGFLPHLGEKVTIVVVAILFTLLHAFQYEFPMLMSLFVLSLILTSARVYTGSIIPSMLIHFVNNALAYAVMLLAKS